MAINKHIARIIAPMLFGKKVLTLGRHHMWNKQFCEPWMVANGAKKVHSVDCDGSEGATFVMDLNSSFPTQRYDFIFDGGTLEHVFNVPMALYNIKCNLPIGGIFCSTQLGNLTGHGFWTLSPELLIKWSEVNGFVNQKCIAWRLGPCPKFRQIDTRCRDRIEISSVVPFMYCFTAIKARNEAAIPFQSGPSMNKSKWDYWLREARLMRHKEI